MTGCRICGSTVDLTKHHLLPLHKGRPSEREIAHTKLRAVLTVSELAVLASKPAPEWWETRR